MKTTSFLLIMAVLCFAIPTVVFGEEAISIDLGDGVKFEAVFIPHGTYMQGSPAAEAGRGNDESQREVTLTQDFYLGKYPVTVGQFAQFVKETGYKTEAERGKSGGFGFTGGEKLEQKKEFNWRNPGFPQTDSHPVTSVTYDDALAFVRWVAKKSQRKTYLPTEAQWEYACRAGTTTAYYSGDSSDGLQEIGWFKTNAGNGTRPVGEREANQFGLFDMNGNVYEWCRDWFGTYEGDKVKNPEETRSDRTKPARRVLRGGSWLKGASGCRSASRYRNDPKSRNADNGFRVAFTTEVVVENPDSTRADSPNAAVMNQEMLTTSNGNAPTKNETSAKSGDATINGMADTNNSSRNPPPANAPTGNSQPVLPNFGTTRGSISFASLLCLGGFGIFAAVVIIAVLKAIMGSRPKESFDDERPPRKRFPQPQIGDDGFWIDTSDIPPGSTVNYRYFANGQEYNDSAIVQPGSRQFVFTGGVPMNVVILDAILVGTMMNQSRDPLRTRPEDQDITPPHTPPSSPSKFSGYPTAY
jgi:formylglycine-generating enzyme required for sulfatase activity